MVWPQGMGQGHVLVRALGEVAAQEVGAVGPLHGVEHARLGHARAAEREEELHGLLGPSGSSAGQGRVEGVERVVRREVRAAGLDGDEALEVGLHVRAGAGAIVLRAAP
jgi:hypothetical protein